MAEKPSEAQKAFLRDLGISVKPLSKDDASRLIGEAVDDWEEIFSERFLYWHSAPREITRPILIYAKKSDMDAKAKGNSKFTNAQVDSIVRAAVGENAFAFLKKDTDGLEISSAFHYIEEFAKASGARELTPTQIVNIAAEMRTKGMWRTLCGAGLDIQDDFKEPLKIFQRANKANQFLAARFGVRLRTRTKAGSSSASQFLFRVLFGCTFWFGVIFGIAQVSYGWVAAAVGLFGWFCLKGK